MNLPQALMTVAVIALVTGFTRALPFLVFRSGETTSAFLTYLGKTLPFAVIGMLVIFCLKGTGVLHYPYGLPELLAVTAVVLLQCWKRSTFLSIGGGTVLYMVLVQFVFAAG